MTPNQLKLMTTAVSMVLLALAMPAAAQDSFPQLQTTLPGAGGQQGYPQQAAPQPAQGLDQTPGRSQQPGMAQQPGFNPQVSQPGQQSPGFQPAPGDQLADIERQDFGVPARAELHQGPMHGKTPNQIPGGQLVTTSGLVELLQRQDVRALVFDVLGGQQTLPQAIPAVAAHAPGSFDDPLQGQLGQYLAQVTEGRRDTPLVFYCLSVECWMSYNAALRAINLGYSNVLWYRGGIEAWQRSGLPLQPAG